MHSVYITSHKYFLYLAVNSRWSIIACKTSNNEVSNSFLSLLYEHKYFVNYYEVFLFFQALQGD